MAKYWKSGSWADGPTPLLEPNQAQLSRSLVKISLPQLSAKHSKSSSSADPIFAPILEKLNVHTPQALNLLREAIQDYLMKLQEKTQQQAIQDYAAGKYKDITEVPLYRTPDGDLTNIPEDMLRWFV